MLIYSHTLSLIRLLAHSFIHTFAYSHVFVLILFPPPLFFNVWLWLVLKALLSLCVVNGMAIWKNNVFCCLRGFSHIHTKQTKRKIIGVAGLRSPCLPHAKGVLYQVSYNPTPCSFFLSSLIPPFSLSFVFAKAHPPSFSLPLASGSSHSNNINSNI